VRIICVTKTSELRERLRRLFPTDASQVDYEPNLDRVLERFEETVYDILLISSVAVREGEIDGVEMLDVVSARSPGTQVLFLAEERDLKLAMSSLAAGAYQYATLPISDDELRLLVEAAIANRPPDATPLRVQKDKTRARMEDLVGRSSPMQQVYRQIRQAAATDVAVLLVGETGTGKDLAADAIHRQSAVSNGPFVPVHLGALPAELVASELFGHEKGAFTGALERYQGKFEQSKGGTIFLDEIGTLEERVQISLLRVLERKEFQRLGGKRAVKADVRILAATNEELSEAVANGSFREDLYYRLDVFRIALPPLRERQGDIPLLIDHFLKRYNRYFQKNVSGISPECIAALEGSDWPGNVRELKNVIQRAVLVCQGEVILPEHLPPRFRPGFESRPTVTFEIGTPLHEVERELIVRSLASVNNNRTAAAKLLGISRRALYNKIDKYGV